MNPLVSVNVKDEKQQGQPGPLGINFSIKLEELKKRKIFLAVPMYAGISHGIFVRSAIELSAQCAQLGIQLQLYFLFNESLITRARNYCCDEFMRSDATHLMFIDSDIGFNPQDVLMMLGLQNPDPKVDDYDVLAGPYPKKTISWEKIVQAVNQGFGDFKAGKNASELDQFVGDYVFNPKAGDGRISLGAPAEISEAGTGFMMIRRNTFEKFKKAYPERAYIPDHIRNVNFDGTREIMQYFQAEIEQLDTGRWHAETLKNVRDGRIADGMDAAEYVALRQEALEAEQKKYSRRYLSEDYLFCKDVQKIGMRCWLLPWMRLQHAGSYVFGGSLVDLCKIGATATADPEIVKKSQQGGLTPSGLPPVRKS